MPFPKEAQRRGGRRPATASQKAAAQKWAVENQPWRRSTGPRSESGKAIVSLNPNQFYFRRRVEEKKLGVAGFEQACQETERFIELFWLVIDALESGFSVSVVRRAGGGTERAPARWAFFGIKVRLIGSDQGVDAALAVLDRLVSTAANCRSLEMQSAQHLLESQLLSADPDLGSELASLLESQFLNP